MVRLGVTNSRLAPNKLTPLRSEGVVRQGNRQAGKAAGRGLQANNERTSALGATSRSLVAPRLFIIAAFGICSRSTLVKPRPGEWTVLGQGRHGRDRRRDINTRSGQSIRDAGA